jgi:hypothetical protein
MKRPTKSVRRIWVNLLGVGHLVLLLALLPSVLYIDHWSEYFGWTHDADSPGAEEVHQGHCHLNPSTCSDQPLPPGPKMTWEVVELKEPALPTTIALDETLATETGFVVSVPTEPPRLA